MKEQFTKQELKDGMIVEDRSGWKALVLNTRVLSLDSEEELYLYDFDNDLTYMDDHSCDIMKVYKCVGEFLGETELQWERKEGKEEIKDYNSILKDIPTEKLLEEVKRRMCK